MKQRLLTYFILGLLLIPTMAVNVLAMPSTILFKNQIANEREDFFILLSLATLFFLFLTLSQTDFHLRKENEELEETKLFKIGKMERVQTMDPFFLNSS